MTTGKTAGPVTPSPRLTMNDGWPIPQVGLGVFKIPDPETAGLVRQAIEIGYRHIDTATLYQNESGVGQGMRDSGVPRGELFVTTKVWNDRHGYDQTLAAFQESYDRLGLDYVDLYLIHWPAVSRGGFLDTWRALEKLRADGLVRSIGVSNFQQHHLEQLLEASGTVPVVNQVELNPWIPLSELRAYDAEQHILTEAWAPLARGGLLEGDIIQRIAAKHGKTPAQVVIRWHVDLGNVVIPKSSRIERMAENLDVFDFQLDRDDLEQINKLRKNHW